MDIELEKRINEAIDVLRQLSFEDIDFQQMDPVAKMMLVALIGEAQKLQDYIDGTTHRLIERFCVDFIPRQKVEAMPAICLVSPKLKNRADAITYVGSQASFVFKTDKTKSLLNYIPIFETALLPHESIYRLTQRQLRYTDNSVEDNPDIAIDIQLDKPNRLWVGIKTSTEVECMRGLSMLIRGTHGVMPEHIYAVAENRELDFATMLEMENIEMVEPFDAQQASGEQFAFVETWKECLLNMDDAALLYITDPTEDRDMFKPRTYPRQFQQWLEGEVLARFEGESVWLRLDFPEDYAVPDTCEVQLGVMPVTNVDICSLTLTQTQPIAKLQKTDDSFFLRILETSTAQNQQGFNMTADEIIVRDFDAQCYDNGALHRDVRYLYNRFVDDYYAFIEYNGIKDGEVLKQLRETINKLGKSVGQKNDGYRFDSGTFVMKNMSQYPQTQSTRVSFITTMGVLGNLPHEGDTMDNRRLPALEQKVPVVMTAQGGADKSTADERYEQLRYYSLTNDRLYTRMDIDAFLRKEIMAEFGREEFRRIYIKTSIQGAGGADFLRRGLYIDIEFKDRKNYQHAVTTAFDKMMQQKIINKSCIAMPIIVSLKNLED
ncbi:MAG: hypothetical protein II949_06645 [Prevotella sp.]|nr:hypothetical protein [Prevotella sp.]